MTIQQIVAKDEKSLQPTAPVTDFHDKYIKQAIRDLLDTLANQQKEFDKIYPDMGMGVGLAANQIKYPTDFYPKDFQPPNIYVVSIRPARAVREKCAARKTTVYINATFTPIDAQQSKSFYEEGCLSIDGIKGYQIPRYEKIRVIAYDSNGEQVDFIEEGFNARVHQHEIDHGRGQEYLNHLTFTTEELHKIADWIEQHKSHNIKETPVWIIPNKLQCTHAKPDLNALSVWLKHELAKHSSVSEQKSQFTLSKL